MIWARQPKMAVIWAVLALACYLPGAAADFFRIAIQADITDASWGQTDLRAVPANIPIPVGTEAPPDFLKIYHYNGPSDSPGNAGYGLFCRFFGVHTHIYSDSPMKDLECRSNSRTV